MEEQESFFSDAPTGRRFLILNKIREQTFPKGPLTIVDAEKRTSGNGTTYPVLVLEDEKGNTFEATAWARDVKACLEQYGGGHPKTWGQVEIVVGPTRAYFVPVKETIIEENIGE